MTLNEWIERENVDVRRVIVRVETEYWLRAEWDRMLPNGGMVHVIPLPPQSGGGSNPLSMLMMVAIAVAAVYTGGLAAGAMGFVAGTAGYAAVSAGVSMAVMAAGSMLVNAIIPPKSANVSQGTGTSPTYSLAASGNQARLLEAIPVLYGRMKVKPDLASQPFTEYVGNEQYLYELFCISQGEVNVEQVLIGDTDIGNFSEITWQVVGPNQPVTLFPDNVVTSEAIAGIELQAPNDSGDWVGPYTANPAGTKANFIGFDVTLPSGLFYANDDGSLGTLAVTFEIQARQIDDAGNAQGGWIGLDTRTLSMAAAQPQAISYRYGVDAARYEVRARRTSKLNEDSRAQNRIQWAALRAYLPSERYYGNVTLLAMRARATNNLNSSTAHDVNVIATRRVPVWTGNGWSEPRPTTNPAWAVADAVRNRDYGRGLPDRRLDIDALVRLADVWSSRGDEFNGVFDSVGSFWDGLTTICRAGRAVPMYLGGVVTVVRDELKAVRTALFSPANICAGTLTTEYGFYSVDTPDHVVIEYMDEATWSWQDVACVPDGSPALVEKRIQMIGPTKREQAFREGIYAAYANRDQRKTVSFTAELDGLIPLYGDLVGVSHDLPRWGISGEVEAVEGACVHVSEQLEWTAGAQHYVRFVGRNGAPTIALRVMQNAADGDAMSMLLMDALPAGFRFGDGVTEDPTRFAFGPSVEQVAQDVRLIRATPRQGQVELTFVNNAESPHTAELGMKPPPPASPSLLPGVIHAPIVAEVTANARVTPGYVSIAASPASGAALYEFQASADGGRSWAALGTISTNSVTVPIAPGVWMFRVRAYGTSGLAGPFAVCTSEIASFAYLPAAPTVTLREPFTGDQVSIEIQRLPDVDFFHVEVVSGGVTRYAADITGQSFVWTLDQAKQYGAAVDTFAVSVTAGNSAGMGPTTFLTVKSQAPAAPAVTVFSNDGYNAILHMSVSGAVKAVGYVVKSGGTVVQSGTETECTVPAAKTYQVTAYNGWGSESASTQVSVPADTGGGGWDGGGFAN